MIRQVVSWLKQVFFPNAQEQTIVWQERWSKFLEEHVLFYRGLSKKDKLLFNRRIILFLYTTSVESGQVDVSDEDRLLVAASAIIPVWGFDNWHYFNLESVYLLPTSFNENFECYQHDSHIAGMVGTGPMSGKMVLSHQHLYQGFKNSRDKQNVGIHEFAHLIDMADGECDGFPERLMAFQYTIPWFSLVEKKTRDIHDKKSNISDYGAKNRAEFFAVATEYFFERPHLMSKKHPELFKALTEFYKQDVRAILQDIKVNKNGSCPCGSGKKYKRCCMPGG